MADLNDLQREWDSQPEYSEEKMSEIAQLVRTRSGSMRSRLFARDMGEVIAAVFIIVVFGVYSFWASNAMTKIGIAITIGGAVEIIVLLQIVRRRGRADFTSLPLNEFLLSEVQLLNRQISLLRHVTWWYLLPLYVGTCVFVFGLFDDQGWLGIVVGTVYSMGYFAFCALIWRSNQHARKTTLEPFRDALQRTYNSVSATDPAAMEANADLASAFADPALAGKCGVEKWRGVGNFRFVPPSWNHVGVFILASLGGAWCGLRYSIDGLGPERFQSVIGAIVAFEISIAGTCLRRRNKQDRAQSANREPMEPASGLGMDDSANEGPQFAPSAPAGPGAGPTLFMGFMACLLLLLAMMSMLARGPELEDVSAFSDDDIAHTDVWLRKMKGSFYPSLSAVVVRDGEIVYQGAFGFEDTTTERQATTQTQYHVASVTKAFTASLAVILHERGVVDLDQPVVKYLPEGVSISTTPEVGATITLRQLTSGTSGLPRGVPGQVQSVEGWYQLEPQRLYDHLANVKLHHHDPLVDVKLRFDPDTSDGYSNLGFGLLGHALERAADKPFDRLMQKFVCDPLKLERTAIQANDKLRPATGYAWRSRSSAETRHSFKERLAASDGLVTTVEDLAKFLAAQMKPGVFTSEMLDQLHTETTLPDGSASGTAFG